MLKELLKDNILIIDSVSDWQEALRIGADCLLKKGFIKEEYIKAIIDDVYKYGPYIVLTDGAAMPHSRPENGVIKKSMSLLKVRSGVDFYKTEKKVYLFFTLAAEDSNGHQDAVLELADFLCDNEKLNKLITEDLNEKEILNLI
ncbi:PTS sugar transporter subunit IIA [uncultured Brachyspira sp.]|uniref:PTS sugar transporter subunit IIA n=1 Tax=uncultured Brachyspira sp. TaxID=221953 RepID=UPI00260A7607|nr:PTS sugar transporter subunit IIA [uncultured Brachyspira sp.]